jgi:O-antigen biosynthesis protein WbqP
MYVLVKRIMDIILAMIGLIILSPLFILIILCIKIDSKGSTIFKQKRVGKGMSHFNILKFRTMRIDTPKEIPTHLLENSDYYITRVGRILRRTSLDELPQLWNILLGHMSIVGPRPALWNQFDLIKERDKYGANDIRPGLTGWAQINGRDELIIEDKARLDGEYVRKMSLLFDCRCILWTFKSIWSQDGLVEGKVQANIIDNIEADINNKEAI